MGETGLKCGGGSELLPIWFVSLCNLWKWRKTFLGHLEEQHLPITHWAVKLAFFYFFESECGLLKYLLGKSQFLPQKNSLLTGTNFWGLNIQWPWQHFCLIPSLFSTLASSSLCSPAGLSPACGGRGPYGCPRTDFPWGAGLHLLAGALSPPQHQQQLAPGLGRLRQQRHRGLRGHPAQPHQHLPCYPHHHHRCLLSGLRGRLGGKLSGHVCHHKVRGFGVAVWKGCKWLSWNLSVGGVPIWGDVHIREGGKEKVAGMTPNLFSHWGLSGNADSGRKEQLVKSDESCRKGAWCLGAVFTGCPLGMRGCPCPRESGEENFCKVVYFFFLLWGVP